ncbi:MAG: histidinol-phosphate transaminase [Gammaproteobacteria bacterium]
MLTPRPGILKIRPHMIAPGSGPAVDPLINIASNESAYGPSQTTIAAGKGALDGINRYTDAAVVRLSEALASRFKLNPRGIVCGFGSDDLLARLSRTYLSPGDELIYSVNGYQKTPNYAYGNDAVPVAAPDKDFKADVDSILSCVSERTRVVMIANPDNPTGTYLSRAEVRRLHERLPANVLLVLDSAYLEYVDAVDFEDPWKMVEENRNVVMTRTFSKIHGLAGVRLGWLYAPEDVAKVIQAIGIMYPVSNVALACGLASLSDDGYVEYVKAENLRIKRAFAARLTEMGVHVYPSQTNFVLARFNPEICTAAAVYDYLYGKRVLVRRFPAAAFANCIRFTIGLEDEMTQVLDHLRDFFAHNARR